MSKTDTSRKTVVPVWSGSPSGTHRTLGTRIGATSTASATPARATLAAARLPVTAMATAQAVTAR